MEMILIIGFGSLMSYYGINKRPSTRDIEIFNPFIVRFKGSRGFNTSEGHYMDIGKRFNPEGVQVSIDEVIDKKRNTIECLAYYVKDEVLQKIAIREDYPNELMKKIRASLNNYNKKSKVQEGKKGIAEFLWTFYPEQENYTNCHEKIYEYRRRLGEHIEFDIINAYSYVPHPVKVKCNQKNHFVFGLISIHTNIGAKRDYNTDIRLMNIREAFHSVNPPRSTYFLECILGGVHGINIRDLLSGMGNKNGEINHYIVNLNENIKEEWNNTQNWNFHGNNLLANLERSGLLEYYYESNSN